MKLKSLELNGFKSFADKTKIDFPSGFTGVVGPNGSGKSNIIEALRWVLGEQSAKHLRGAKMPDIIFAGSSTRSSLNRAEVTLTIDNSDHFLAFPSDEVTIKRRIFADSTSEFLINQKKVRLRDIVELFMDTGLGHESFSIISQGRVEQIFNSKPKERRVLIEEVAEVLKYKKEKSYATRELAETTEHLDRVADIIVELNQQHQTLKEQAAVAQDYLALTEQLTELEQNRLVLKIKQNAAKNQQVKQQLQALLQAQNDQQGQIMTKEVALKHLQTQQSVLQTTLDQKQETMLNAAKTSERLSAKCEILKQKQTFHQLRSTELAGKIAQTTEQIAHLTKQEAALNKQLAELKVKPGIDTTSVVKQQQVVKELAAKQQDLATAQLTSRQEISFLTKQLADLNTQLQTVQNEAIINDNLQMLQANQTKQTAKITHAKAQLVEQEAAVSDQQAVVEQLATNLKKTRLRFQDQNQRVQQAQKILQEAQTRYQTLQKMFASYSGYYQGVKEILQAKKQVPGVIGSVAQAMQVDLQYSLAIETALGGQLQHVIVENTTVAKQAINYLKKQKGGRATFLPRAVIKPRALPAAKMQLINQQPGVLGVASALVHCLDERDQNIIANLLGTTVIVDNLDHATALAKVLGQTVRLVTLQGEVINPGGSLTGGFNKQKNHSLLAESSKLTSLAQEIQTMQAKLQTMQQMQQQLETAVSEQQQVYQQGQAQLAQLQKQTAKQTNELEMAQLQLHYQANELDKLVQVVDKQHQQIDVTQAHIKQVKDLQAQQTAHLAEVTASLNQVSATLTKEQAVLQEQLLIQQEAQQNQLLASEKRKMLTEQLTEITAQIKQLKAYLVSNGEAKTQLQAEQAQIQAQLAQVDEKVLAINEQQQEMTQELTKLKAERLTLSEEATVLTGAVQALNVEFNKLNEQKQKLLVKQSKLSVFLEEDLNELGQKHQTTFEAAVEKVTATDLNQVQQALAKLKRQLKALGVVNVGALAEFKRVDERYQFLVEQQTDLLVAKEQLELTMAEMDKEVAQRFQQTFNAINAAFKELFPQIFGGGKAELVLTDPTDFLTTGIEITAQSPGKKLQQLALLSGGEKALTALTLLFAILKVRPVPFIVLDEAEAALDDANVARYARYLNKFSDQTQFIVITHRKATMMEADVLYGVTMQEAGVSSIVSVALQ